MAESTDLYKLFLSMKYIFWLSIVKQTLNSFTFSLTFFEYQNSQLLAPVLLKSCPLCTWSIMASLLNIILN
jgi:hypothetical protein